MQGWEELSPGKAWLQRAAVSILSVVAALALFPALASASGFSTSCVASTFAFDQANQSPSQYSQSGSSNCQVPDASQSDSEPSDSASASAVSAAGAGALDAHSSGNATSLGSFPTQGRGNANSGFDDTVTFGPSPLCGSAGDCPVAGETVTYTVTEHLDVNATAADCSGGSSQYGSSSGTATVSASIGQAFVGLSVNACDAVQSKTVTQTFTTPLGSSVGIGVSLATQANAVVSSAPTGGPAFAESASVDASNTALTYLDVQTPGVIASTASGHDYSTPGAPACTVTAIRRVGESGFSGPYDQEDVTAQSGAGLQSVGNVQINNGTVEIPSFTPGTTSPVVITATKAMQGVLTQWSFGTTDVLGQATLCQ